MPIATSYLYSKLNYYKKCISEHKISIQTPLSKIKHAPDMYNLLFNKAKFLTTHILVILKLIEGMRLVTTETDTDLEISSIQQRKCTKLFESNYMV